MEWHFSRTVAILATVAVLIATLNFLLPVVKVNAMARTIDGRLYRIAGLNGIVVGQQYRLHALGSGRDKRAAIGLRERWVVGFRSGGGFGRLPNERSHHG